MKYLIGILALYTSLLYNQAQAKTVGLGAVLGAPTGFSVNLFMNEKQTIHTTMAWDLDDDDEDELQLASHYSWRRHDFAENNLGWFYGAGARLVILDENHRSNRDHDDFLLGPSVTSGLFYEFDGVPVEIFVKANLTINIVEDTDSDVDAMLGGHYNF